jgi:hypothetical protein
VSWTKRQYVTAALEEVGLASYVFDLQPDQIESAVHRLDSMMAEWNARGIRIGYPLPPDPESTDIDADAGTPDSAHEAILTNLAIRLAPSYGKQVAAETKATARHALNTLMARAAFPPEMQLPSSLPSGAGNKGRTYTQEPEDPLAVGPDGELTLE